MFELQTPLLHINPQGGVEEHPLTPPTPEEIGAPRSVGHLSRLEAFQAIVAALQSSDPVLLYDPTFSRIRERVETLDNAMLRRVKAAALLFTSGTTGTPVGAFKTRENLLLEVEALAPLIGQPKAVISTVPQIHLYGLLFGLVLPVTIGATPIIKETFLPSEIIWLARDFAPAVVVTTPVFIKALHRLSTPCDLNNTLFVSSTGYLDPKEAALLQKRFNAHLLSIYGSTETGGIGYRLDDETRWTPLKGVELSQENGNLAVHSQFVSTHTLNRNIQPTESTIITSDMANIRGDGSFELVGRNSDLIKIAGKRLSLIEIEEALESEERVDGALVLAGKPPEGMKEEHLNIYIVSQMSKSELQPLLKSTIRSLYPNLNIRFSLVLVDKIARNPMGKKLRQHPATTT